MEIDITKELKEAARMGAREVLEQVGLANPEISRNRAFQTYGREWVLKMISDKRLKPCRRGEGRTGTQYFAVMDILAIKAQDAVAPAIL